MGAAGKHRDRGTPRLVSAVRAVLPQAATLQVAAMDGSEAILLVGSRQLRAHWVGRGGLEQVRRLLGTDEQPDVVVGSELSLGARALLSETGLGWVDETGAAEIAVGDLVVSRSGARRTRTPEPRWSPAVVGVAEALLCGVPATVAATAEVTGHSTSSVAGALAALSTWGLLASDAARGPRSGRRVTDPDRLLDEYAHAIATQRPRPALRCGVLWRDPLATIRLLGERWDDAGVAWAATGTVAAEVLAPNLTVLSGGVVYVDADGDPGLRNAARAAAVDPMDGGRLVLEAFPTRSSRLLATVESGIRIVPWPRAYADLRHVGVRGEEAAEHMKELRGGAG